MQARRDFINLLLASSLAGSAFSAFAQQPPNLLYTSASILDKLAVTVGAKTWTAKATVRWPRST
jgi:hypothetical protein